jgi:hypothetical protein
MITNSSFSDPEIGQRVLLFPAFKSILLPDVRHSTVEHFIQQYLLPETLHPMHDALSASQKKTLTRVPHSPTALPNSVYSLRKPTILICSHNSRDVRCGVMGPLLQSEFVRQLHNLNFDVSAGSVFPLDGPGYAGQSPAARVGLISHVGGHKWAGNVILYVPRVWGKAGKVLMSEEQKADLSPLAGYGIWYGRVEPKHVEGIIKETILSGSVIKELFRGGIGPKSEILRLPLDR